MNALIGHTGFVGTTLKNQTRFDALYRSTNVEEIRTKEFDTVVCAAAPAQKWIANREPARDWDNIQGLISHLDRISAANFILISTVDVFRDPVGVDEHTPVEEEGLHAYGLHRRWLEKFIEERFERHLIVRLPGLVGPGLRKNVVFDLLTDNNLDTIDSRAIFQFYPMVNLWFDIQLSVRADLELVHLTAEPISVADVSEQGFGRGLSRTLHRSPGIYDMRSRHAAVFGARGNYQYTRRETLQAIRSYAQSEPHASRSTSQVAS